MQISLVLIVYRSNSDIAKETAIYCEELLTAKGIKSLKLSSAFHKESINKILSESPPDLAIVLGGDGTVLKSANEFLDLQIPIISFNIGGHLGFLTQDNTFLFNKSFVDLLIKDEFIIDNRKMIECNLFKEDLEEKYPKTIKYFALNDFYLKSIEDCISATNRIRIEIDKERINDYKGDGLIISSPTGSTAYSMAAGGPIVHPVVNALIISPICPVSLSNRSIVVPDTSSIVIKTINNNIPLRLWKDGMKCLQVNSNDYCEIRKSAKATRIIILKDNMSYYSTLIKKLEWKGDLTNSGSKDI